MAALATVLLVTRASFADQYVVPSESMMPTVRVGDRVFVSKLAYGLRVPFTHLYLTERSGPRRGDVVVLDAPDQDLVLLKRVVAVEGDHVRVRDGAVTIEGRPVSMRVLDGASVETLDRGPHAVSLESGGGPDFDGVVPRGQVLVLGDNRGNSRDGRFFGFVSRHAILGRVEGTFVRAGRVGWWRF